MSAILQSNEPAAPPALGPAHGYRFEGDTAFLNAELRVPPPTDAARTYALQLWACQAPFGGGTPEGIKVAEAPLSPEPPPRLEAATFARLPPAQRDYAMVLVLAAGARGVYDQVLDYANYPAPQRFVAPQLEGGVGYRIDGDSVVLEAERVHNPRDAGNLSGTLALELWAHAGRYAGGEVVGTRLGQVELPPLAGQAAHESVRGRGALVRPPPGRWQLTLMLREWTAAEGYRTRDYRTFAAPYEIAAIAANPEAPRGEPARAEPPAAQAPQAQPPHARAPRADAARTPRAKQEAPASRTPVSLQHASVEALARVPGLNARLAAAIVRKRPFASLDELTKVRGIGDKLLRALRPHLTL